MNCEFSKKINGDGFFYHHTLTNKPDDRNFSFKSHSHNLYEIYFFVQGKASFTIEGNTYKLKKGTIIFIKRGQSHNILISNSSQPYERYVFLFDEKHFPQGFNKLLMSENSVFYLDDEKNKMLSSIFKIIDEAEKFSVPENTAVLSSIGIIISMMQSISGECVSENIKNDKLVMEIIDFVNSNLGNKWSLLDLEKHMYRDKAYLNRKFKSVMGCGIWEYNMQKRIFSARQVLIISGDINTAFNSSGFGDYSSFYRKYVKYIGHSPKKDLDINRE